MFANMLCSPVFRSVLLAAASVIALSGCGGGGGGGSSMLSEMGGETSPVEFSLSGLPPISVIHLEATDGQIEFLRDNHYALTNEGRVAVSAGETARDKVVCPGVPPWGNECTALERVIGDRAYDYSEDLSVGVVIGLLEAANTSVTGSIAGMKKIEGSAASALRASYGGAGDYSVFSALNIDEENSYRTIGFSFGALYSGLPTPEQGSATWRGAMTAYPRQRPSSSEGHEIDGTALLEYDFASDTVDLTLDPQNGPIPSEVPDNIIWRDLQVNDDGSFYIRGHGNHNRNSDPHPTLGYVDGDFYGPNAEEMAGVFERYGIVGAFGGKRERN